MRAIPGSRLARSQHSSSLGSDALRPTVVDSSWDSTDPALAARMSRYVEWEWQHGRHILEEHVLGQANQRVLEYGSYLGATAIIMARLGAQVTACDIDLNFLRAATRNARRYGVQDRI